MHKYKIPLIEVRGRERAQILKGGEEPDDDSGFCAIRFNMPMQRKI